MLHKNRAFTLVELAVVLIIIACILAAFAPIMTKKISQGKFSLNGDEAINNDLFIPFDTLAESKYLNCDPVPSSTDNGTKVRNCTVKGIVANSIHAILVGAGGGGAGATSGAITQDLERVYVGANTDKIEELSLDSNMENIRLTMYSGGGGGGGSRKGSAYLSGSADSSTEKFDLIGACTNMLVIINGSAGGGGGGAAKQIDADNYKYYSGASGASGGKMTFTVADEYVPASAHIELKGGLSGAGGAGGLTLGANGEDGKAGEDTYIKIFKNNLSTQDSNLVYAMVLKGGGGGKGGDTSSTVPAIGGKAPTCARFISKNYNGSGIWEHSDCNDFIAPFSRAARVVMRDFFREGYDGNPGVITQNITATGGAMQTSGYYSAGGKGGSVVVNGSSYVAQPGSPGNLDGSSNYTCSGINTGGGGGAGAGVIDEKIDNDILLTCKNTPNCKLILNIGARGKGGKENIDGGNGSKVEVSLVSNSKTFWNYSIDGGKGGGRASYNGPGAGGKRSENGPILGTDGSSSDGKGGSLSDEYTFGYGGNGYADPDSIDKFQGTDGANGYISVKYNLFIKGTSGGGGGGGAFARIHDIKITPAQSFQIQIGKGGSGGIDGQSGIDGGDTIIKVNSNIYKANGGAGGKTGTIGNGSEERTPGLGGAGGKLEGIEASSKKWGSKNGGDGQPGIINNTTINAKGGLGGQSGISLTLEIVQIACGGLNNRNSPNGCGDSELSANSREPEHIYDDGNFGSYGAGGGGGGWQYIESTGVNDGGQNTGKGGDGQDGYVYLYW